MIKMRSKFKLRCKIRRTKSFTEETRKVNSITMRTTWSLEIRLMNKKANIKRCLILSMKSFRMRHSFNKLLTWKTRTNRLFRPNQNSILRMPLAVPLIASVLILTPVCLMPMSNATKADTLTSTVREVESITSKLDLMREDRRIAAPILLIFRLKDILIPTQICNIH